MRAAPYPKVNQRCWPLREASLLRMGLGGNGREMPRPSPQPLGPPEAGHLGVSLLMSLSLFAPCDPAFLGLSASSPSSPSVFSWMKRDLCFSLHVSLCTCLAPCSSVSTSLSVHPDVSLISICPCLCVSGGSPQSLSLSFHLSHTISHSLTSPLQKHCLSQSWWAAAPLPPTQVSLLLILLGLEEGWGESQIWCWSRLGISPP